jgi:hypothetical protein
MRARSHFNRAGVRAERWSLFVVPALVVGGTVAASQVAHWTPTSIGAARWPLFVFGLVLMAAGLALRQSLILLAVIPTAGLLVRIRSEERVLLAALGDDYKHYAASHRRLFPGLW